MTSLALILLVYLFWAIVGRSLLAVFSPKIGVLKAWLLAPAIGLALMTVFLMVLNQAGLPIDRIASIFTIFIILLTCFTYWITRPIFPVKRILPFIGALFITLFVIAWPALKLHFNWISFVTDDYVNYCLAADRFKQFGFYRLPTVDELTGRDYTQYFWFMHVPALVRFGAEHQIAWLSKITGLRTLQVFMPMIVALSLVQMSSLSALVLHKGRYRKHATWAAILLAISPLFVFGVVYELIAQVGGVALMLALCSFLTSLQKTRSRLNLLKQAVPISITAAALAVFYPEVTPFAVLTVVGFFFIEWFTTKQFPGAKVVLLEYVLILFFLLLRHNVISYIYSLSNQLMGGLRQNDLSLSLFPFFLIPSGISSLVGLQAMNADVLEPWGSILIFLGILFILGSIWTAIKGSIDAKPFALLLTIEGCVALALFRTGNDFGTYKMAMYIQPVLMASFAYMLLQLRSRYLQIVLGAFIVLCMLKTDIGYTKSSAGGSGDIVAEVQNVSAALVSPPPGPSQKDYWMSSIDNMVAAKLAAQVYRAGFVKFPSRDLFPVSAYLIQADWPLMQWYPHREVYDFASKLMDMRNQELYLQGSVFGTEFSEPKASLKPTHYLSLTSSRNLFNKFYPDGKSNDDFFVVKKANEVSNFIIFVHSSLGSHYYLGDRKNISFYQQEYDYFDPAAFTNAMGRFFLLRIENPSPEVYVRLAVSKTLMAKDRKTWSQEASIKATTDVTIPFVGSGAANVYAGPVKPVKRGDAYYIAIDMGEGARAFPSRRSGLKAMYNQEIPLDYRWLISYGRDISVVSPEDYRALERPLKIEKFPEDIIKAKGFEFSGIYEDGWLSPDSHFILGESHAGDVVRVRFEIPKGLLGSNAIGDAKVCVNGSSPLTLPVAAGSFDWLIPIKVPSEKTDIRATFSLQGVLPDKDDRIVAAKLEYIKLLPISKVDFATVNAPRPPTKGIDTDGWCDADAVFDMPVNAQSKGIVLTLDYPGWWNVSEHSSIAVKLDDLSVHTFELKQGKNVFIVPAPSGVSMRHVRIKADHNKELNLPDGRKRFYTLLYAECYDEQFSYNQATASHVRPGVKVDYATTGAPRPPTEGINSDGWANKYVTISLPITRDSNAISIDIDYPGWKNVPSQNEIEISLDGEKPVTYFLQQGSNHIVLNAPVGFRVRNITLKAAKTFIMPDPKDRRECAYRLVSVQSN